MELQTIGGIRFVVVNVRAKATALDRAKESMEEQITVLRRPYKEARLRWAADELVRGAAVCLGLDEYEYTRIYTQQHYPQCVTGIVWVEADLDPRTAGQLQKYAAKRMADFWTACAPTEAEIAAYEPMTLPFKR